MKGYLTASMWVITGNEGEYKRICLRMVKERKSKSTNKKPSGGINTNLRLKEGRRENMQL